MTVNSVTFKQSVTLSSEAGNKIAMATKWKVNFRKTSALSFSSTKTYHVVILNEEKQKEGWRGHSSTTTSAYVTSTIPKKSDLSKSTLHTVDSSDTEVLNDHTGKPICSFEKTDLVDLGFTIDKAEFAKVNEISPALIKNIGDFLRTHLETTSSPSPSSPPKAEEKREAPEAAKAPEKAEAKDAPKATAPSKGLTRPSLSNLCGRVAPLLVGFAFTSLALAVSHLFSS